MSNALRVGIGSERVALRDQFFAQFSKVLNNAVVNNGNLIGAVRVRMGVALAGSAMRRPTRMTNAARSLAHIVLDGISEAGNLAQTLNHIDSPTVLDGNTRRVVPTVLKAL